MSDQPSAEVYLAAAKAYISGTPGAIRQQSWDMLAKLRARDAEFQHAVDVAWRLGFEAGRTAASQAIRDHADEHFPADGQLNTAQRSFRRHLLAAANVADNPVTLAQAAEALKRGDYIACRAEDIEGVDG